MPESVRHSTHFSPWWVRKLFGGKGTRLVSLMSMASMNGNGMKRVKELNTCHFPRDRPITSPLQVKSNE